MAFRVILDAELNYPSYFPFDSERAARDAVASILTKGHMTIDGIAYHVGDAETVTLDILYDGEWYRMVTVN